MLLAVQLALQAWGIHLGWAAWLQCGWPGTTALCVPVVPNPPIQACGKGKNLSLPLWLELGARVSQVGVGDMYEIQGSGQVLGR